MREPLANFAEGHFHLAPELFLQVSGWTRFGLPHGDVVVGPGGVLLMPARLLHHEAVGVAGRCRRRRG